MTNFRQWRDRITGKTKKVLQSLNRSEDTSQALVALADEFVHEEFARYEEHDADHAFHILYQRLQEDLCCANLEEITDEEIYGDLDEEIWGSRTMLTDIFSSEVMLSYECTTCGASEHHMDIYQPMSFNLTKNGDTLSDAFNKSMISESERVCGSCDSVEGCRMTKNIVDPPNYMKVLMDGEVMEMHPLDSDLTVGGVSYEFLGALVYSGDGKRGHYCYVKKTADDGSWLLYDDKVVNCFQQLPRSIVSGANVRSYRKRQ